MLRVASLFSQILSVFPRSEFQQAVKKHRAERHSKGFLAGIGSWPCFSVNSVRHILFARSVEVLGL